MHDVQWWVEGHYVTGRRNRVGAGTMLRWMLYKKNSTSIDEWECTPIQIWPITCRIRSTNI
jgi:hypothetical protein